MDEVTQHERLRPDRTILRLMADRGLNAHQVHIGTQPRIPYSTLERRLGGDYDSIRWSELVRIATLLGVTVADLMDPTDADHITPARQAGAA